MDEFFIKHTKTWPFKRLTEEEMMTIGGNPAVWWNYLEAAYAEIDRVVEILVRLEYEIFFKQEERIVQLEKKIRELEWEFCEGDGYYEE